MIGNFFWWPDCNFNKKEQVCFLSHKPVCFFRAGSPQTRERSPKSLAKHFRLTEIALLPFHAVSQGDQGLEVKRRRLGSSEGLKQSHAHSSIYAWAVSERQKPWGLGFQKEIDLKVFQVWVHLLISLAGKQRERLTAFSQKNIIDVA